MSDFQKTKFYLVEHLHLAKDALHIYTGVLVFLVACFVFRWRATQLRPLLLVFLVACAGEIWDFHDSYVRHWPPDFPEHFKDIADTTAVPLIILLLARFTRIFHRPEPVEEGVPEDDEDRSV